MKSPEMGMGVPKTPEQEKAKIFISKDWTPEERKALVELMNKKIDGYKTEEEHLRETIKYEAPCFKELARKIELVQELIDQVDDERTGSGFLEINRQNFKEFVLHA
jgi:hypothetical protein